ncbi:MAG: DMT family transporter [Hyphomicrobiaceae bacterium]|nr:DMT family transporter [Hyphomicrobiaceae bacterium]
MAWLWVIFTVLAAGGQTLRNALQRELTETLGTVGATHVRFLYGLPFGLIFLTLVLIATGGPLPPLHLTWLGWTTVGAITQILATALLLAAMREKNFVIITALSKTEPVHVALFGFVVLGETLSLGTTLAILIAVAGVLLMSWPSGALISASNSSEGFTWRPIILGLVSASVFAMSAIGFRRGILSLGDGNFVLRASTTLAAGLAIQSTLLTAYLLATSPQTLTALFKAWRPSVKAGFMGAFASQMWFLAFAVETAAKVRTLALVEILFAGLISRKLFKQGIASREAAGIALIVVGVVILLNQ